jgi:hypothetical protein
VTAEYKKATITMDAKKTLPGPGHSPKLDGQQFREVAGGPGTIYHDQFHV